MRATLTGALRIDWRFKGATGAEDLSGSFVSAREVIVRCDRRVIGRRGMMTSRLRRVTGERIPGTLLGARGMTTRLEGGVANLRGGAMIVELRGAEDPPVRGATLGAVRIWWRSWTWAKPSVAAKSTFSSATRNPKSIVRAKWIARMCSPPQIRASQPDPHDVAIL